MEYSAALYMRLSKDDGKSESRSIDSQRKILMDYIKENGFSVFGEYIDDGFSGTNFERPAFKRMINDIENGKINLVVTKDLSRLGRDYIAAGKYTEEFFPSKGVRYVALVDGYDSKEPFSDIMPFRNLMNEMYARDISRKIRSAFSARMKNGDFVGAFAPFGYRRKKNNRHRLEADPEAAKIVEFIFEESAGGKKPLEIAKALDEKNVRTPLEYRKNIPKNKNWNSAEIIKILKNKTYLGHTVQGKTSKISFKSKVSVNIPQEKWIICENTHQAIITPEIFEKANKNHRKR